MSLISSGIRERGHHQVGVEHVRQHRRHDILRVLRGDPFVEIFQSGSVIRIRVTFIGICCRVARVLRPQSRYSGWSYYGQQKSE